MVGNLLELLKPPQGHLSQNLALIRDLGGHNTVERANAVGSHHHDRAGAQLGVIAHGEAGGVEALLIRNVQVAHLAGIDVGPARNFQGVRTRGHGIIS